MNESEVNHQIEKKILDVLKRFFLITEIVLCIFYVYILTSIRKDVYISDYIVNMFAFSYMITVISCILLISYTVSIRCEISFDTMFEIVPIFVLPLEPLSFYIIFNADPLNETVILLNTVFGVLAFIFISTYIAIYVKNKKKK